MNKIKILTDSASDIPLELEQKYNIKVLSFPIIIDDKSCLERIDFTATEFYDILLNTPKIPTTSQITSITFLDEFNNIKNEGYNEIIYICINSGGSSTFNSALMAKKQFFEDNTNLMDEFKIHIIDSKCYTMAYGYAVVEAAKKVVEGLSSDKIISFLKNWFDKTEIYFAPYNLDFVKKSGRISAAHAFVGEIIGLRPIISFIDGQATVIEKVRGDKAIITSLLKHAKAKMDPSSDYITIKTLLEDEANELNKKAQNELNGNHVGCFYAGAAISINAGPKFLGIAIQGKNRSET